jgi:twitching motility two-component system response regulator PilH
MGWAEGYLATILIADDSPTAVAVLRRILEPLGHRLVVAVDGLQAARAVVDERARPDLVILDVIMPRPNGFELCRLIKSNPLTAEIPVFMVTSMARESDRYWGLRQGADEYFGKPVDPGVLVEKVRARLPAPRPDPE